MSNIPDNQPWIAPNYHYRATWDETWMTIAHGMAQRSRCVRSKIGAVIVDPSNRVVATSYNGPPAPYPVHETELCFDFCERGANGPSEHTCISYEDCPALHAEANALMVCDRTPRLNGTIYITDHVCFNCAKLIANSGLKRVAIGAHKAADHRIPERSYDFLIDCKLTVDFVR